MANTRKIYEDFIREIREIGCLKSVLSLLHWDQETYLTPGGLRTRAEQFRLLTGIIHQRFVSEKIGEWLNQLLEPQVQKTLSGEEQANVREVKRDYDLSVKIPSALVQEIAKTLPVAHSHWIEARQKDQFSIFAPWLEKIIVLRKEMATALQFSTLYDALIDQFEPGTTTTKMVSIFATLRKELVPMVEKVGGKFRGENIKPIHGNFPLENQRKFSENILRKIGYDFKRGRVDTVVHPFCSDIGDEVRITTRYLESDFRENFSTILHEGGHALYELGILSENRFTPMGEAISLGIHESQSRFWENRIMRSRAFWTYATPLFKEVFPDIEKGVTEEDLFLWMNQIRPGLVRVEADEVTYNLHVLLRFEMEEMLINTEVAVKDLPSIWNQKMKDYLGVTPPGDRLGILQDVHWSLGEIGYFPSYTLGNLYAAQWNQQMQKEIPDMEGKISRGDFSPIRNWLQEKIHRHGKHYRAEELCQRITGERLNPKYFLNYLQEKYLTS